MDNMVIDTSKNIKSISNIGTQGNVSYSQLLDAYKLKYLDFGPYWQVGEFPVTQGWILHISVVCVQFEELLNAVLPLLSIVRTPFKIAKDRDTVQALLDGHYGYVKLGKVMAVYPITDSNARALAKDLIDITQNFKGPRILTDYHLGSVIYTRYGAFNPISVPKELGGEANYIYDNNQNLVEDKYTIPFVLPGGIQWPFDNITCFRNKSIGNILKDRYRIIKTLKEDARGNVSKALQLRNFILVRWCIVKQAKKFMMGDDNGRYLSDRLKWQFKLHQILYNYIPIPKALELFEENEDTYLALEYKRGVSLDLFIVSMYEGRIWSNLTETDRALLITYAETILQIVDLLHRRGFVHRDINTTNFLVSRKRKLTLLDLELAYSTTEKVPMPPFKLGTNGFMSPEQLISQIPSVKEDTYAVGATLIVLFTGLEPSKFETSNEQLLRRQLSFFISDNTFAETIAASLHRNSIARPDISTVREAIRGLKQGHTLYERQSTNLVILKHSLHRQEVSDRINFAIKSLSNPLFISPNRLWKAKTIQDESVAYYQTEAPSIYGGLFNGIGGILYMLSSAHSAGFNIATCLPEYYKGLEYIGKEYVQKTSIVPGGLFWGTSGMVMVYSKAMAAGLIPQAQGLAHMSTLLKHRKVDDFSVMAGAAGRGFALLNASDSLNDDILLQLLQQEVGQLLHTQQSDGSWLTALHGGKGVKATGLANGVAGVTLFLLIYGTRHNDSFALEAAIKGLSWLTRHVHKSKKGYSWYISNKNKILDAGLVNGIAGVALVYIKAYELLQNPLYKQIAESALRIFPAELVMRDLTLAEGIAGIGEVYLSAAHVFKAKEWEYRADWIVQFLLHCYRQQEDGSIYWMMNTYPVPTADLMTGISGVIHYLLRYLNPYDTTFPIIHV